MRPTLPSEIYDDLLESCWNYCSPEQFLEVMQLYTASELQLAVMRSALQEPGGVSSALEAQEKRRCIKLLGRWSAKPAGAARLSAAMRLQRYMRHFVTRKLAPSSLLRQCLWFPAWRVLVHASKASPTITVANGKRWIWAFSDEELAQTVAGPNAATATMTGVALCRLLLNSSTHGVHLNPNDPSAVELSLSQFQDLGEWIKAWEIEQLLTEYSRHDGGGYRARVAASAGEAPRVVLAASDESEQLREQSWVDEVQVAGERASLRERLVNYSGYWVYKEQRESGEVAWKTRIRDGAPYLAVFSAPDAAHAFCVAVEDIEDFRLCKVAGCEIFELIQLAKLAGVVINCDGPTQPIWRSTGELAALADCAPIDR